MTGIRDWLDETVHYQQHPQCESILHPKTTPVVSYTFKLAETRSSALTSENHTFALGRKSKHSSHYLGGNYSEMSDVNSVNEMGIEHYLALFQGVELILLFVLGHVEGESLMVSSLEFGHLN